MAKTDMVCLPNSKPKLILKKKQGDVIMNSETTRTLPPRHGKDCLCEECLEQAAIYGEEVNLDE